ncbi:MAG TPA: hypothetical protein VMW65_10805 [Chloroflexota bacterium]|nr:hypothetical protein [Chloroflexota bacterium]
MIGLSIDPAAWLALVPPAWILIVLLGGLWASLAATLFPLGIRAYLGTLVAAIVGAVIGEAFLSGLGLPSLRLGDIQMLGVSLGAVFAIAVVRRLAA